MVARAGPPKTSTTPKDVNENRKTMAEAAAIDGASRGRTTRRKTSGRDAPSTLAWSSTLASRAAQWAPTVRSTTA